MRRPATHCPAGRYQRLHGRFPLMPAADVHGYSGAGAQDGRCEGVAPARGGRFAVFCAIAVVVAPAAGSAAEVRPGQPARITAASGKPMPAAGPRAVANGTRSDPAVTPAGGVHAGPCGHCRRNACPQCRIPDAGNALVHGPCHHGLCPAHCPVRPDVFGFYGTQWRKWPGSGVIQASNQDEATPARPPKAEVPEATEESLQQPSDGQPPQAPATDGPATDDAMDDREDAAPADRGKAGGKPAPAPLPQPFPGADDGAADRRRIGRRTSRLIFLEKDPEEQADDYPGNRFAARLVTITENDTPEAGDALRPVARVGGDEPRTTVESDTRPSTSWRRFLGPGDGDRAAANGP